MTGKSTDSLTAGDLSIGERQKRGVQRMLSVSEDGVPPVHLLHYFWVDAVLLRGEQGTSELMSLIF